MKKSFLLLTLVVLLSALSATAMFAQDAPRTPRKLQITAADRAAAAEASVVHRHSLTTRTEAGALLKHRESAALNARSAESFRGSSEDLRGGGNDHLRFPGDLTNFFGGPTVPFAESHPIFLASPDGTTCPANTCWGDPDTFLNAYGRSGLAQITDQYVGQAADDRYTLGDQFVLPFAPSSTPLLDADIQAIVHHFAAPGGETGLGHIFHVFLPPGQDECQDAGLTFCYAPDRPFFAFCAYHNAVVFSDIGLVLYTVEPFQNVPGCQARPGTPNGQLIDSTNSVLSHELTETITDPDGDAWRNFTDAGLLGQEIGDECAFVVLLQVAPNTFAAFGDPTTFRVGRHVFATQPEYSNEDHACAIRP